ncbi:sulfonate ABC transporter ATP-binding lipoprotein [Elstera cyanobacteriorum]|uniref:Sulfonate ABC transporter ATP-binding protein n=1 Tax=Elstera cyanobacteriorum TaxID=2022747 RepID=A0A255XXQ4_9PROT|nr:ABC transporter ATP-binding protein [Elstera cyanobacteriorum]OYQ21020.1 sulfonate ABC transporter ATP-binding protein [Elstera cyanobacteriorum]GFZ97937.1 sulfonate ABC transporter ATP-binding lipoprotein [Elstera cyanobacteriorum]
MDETSAAANGSARAEAAQPVIEIADLSLVYQTADHPVMALSHVNLTINKGDFVSFIGPSGCGKTTLMRVVADLEHPTSGKALVNGGTPEQARLDRAYGYVFQAPTLYPWRSVERNVMLPLEIMGLPKAEQKARAKAALELVSLTGFERKFPWQLSGGMQQRVSIARALSFEPQLLLMDEPFGALDEITRDRLNDELLSLWKKTEKTVIFVTHSISEAVYLSTKIVIMSARPGRIIDVIDSPLPRDRSAATRDTQAFLEVAHRVREGLLAGHGQDE